MYNFSRSMFKYNVSVEYCGFSVLWLFEDFKQSVKYNETETQVFIHSEN